jgi:hypothetical protein
MNVYSLGWMKDSILSLIIISNNGEYKAEPIDLHQRAETLTSDLETIMSSPDNMKEANIGFSYYKPSSGLVILREQILDQNVLIWL